MTVSRAERHRIAVALKISTAKIVVSYNGIAPSWLTPLPESQTFAYDLIYVSNFVRHKGHRRFLEAIAGTRWRVLFVGADFGERANIVQYAQRLGIDLTIREGLTQEELIAEYDASRIFVFPSELEGFGIPYIEARARGVPVIAQDLPVFRELQELVGGNLVDFDKPDQLKDALSKSLQEPRSRPDLEPFLWPKLARGLLTNLLH
ncbi:glycosyltransferase [Devosia aurantiaca]|nr:glycosyltransferase [Devosia aurantiaca]